MKHHDIYISLYFARLVTAILCEPSDAHAYACSNYAHTVTITDKNHAAIISSGWGIYCHCGLFADTMVY